MDPENRTPLDDAALGALYASTRETRHTPVVDTAIEARILATARAAPHRRLRAVPWASAAVVLLALGVAWQVVRVDRPERAAHDALAARKQAPASPAVAAPPATSPGIVAPWASIASKVTAVSALPTDAEPDAESAHHGVSAGVVAADAPIMAQAAEATILTDRRLQEVRRLLRDGKRDEARATLADLRARQPDLELDADLDALLAESAAPR